MNRLHVFSVDEMKKKSLEVQKMETETVRDQREINLLLCDQKLVRQVFPELIMVCVCVLTSSLNKFV